MLKQLGRGTSSSQRIDLPTLLSFTQNLPSQVTYARADTVATYRNGNGQLVQASSGEPRIDHREDGLALGILIEGTRTNKIAVYNAAPTSVTGLTLGGTATAAIVTDSIALSAAKLEILGNGKVFQVTGGASGGTVDIAGSVANLNPHSFSVYARVAAGSGASLMHSGLSSGGTVISGGVFKRYKFENQIPVATTNTLRISVPAGCQILFLLPQVEDAKFCSSEIVTTGASATRASDAVYIAALASQSWWNEAAGALNVRYRTYAWVQNLADQYVLVASNGSSGETLGFRIAKADATAIGYVRSQAASLNSLSLISKHLRDVLQSASMSWDNGYSIIYHIGTSKIATYTGTPTGLTELRIGTRNGGSDPLWGWIESVSVYKKPQTVMAMARNAHIGDDAIIVGAGQSLMVGHFISLESGTSGGQDQFHTEMSNAYPSTASIFVNGAKGSSSASKTSNITNYWWDLVANTRGPAFDNFYTKMAEGGISQAKAIIWSQGEEDSHHMIVDTTRAEFKQSVLAVFADMRANLGNPIVLIQRIGRRSDAYTNSINRGVQIVREVQQEIIDENPSWCFLGSEVYDQALYDSVHLEDIGFMNVAKRDARKLSKLLGNSLTGTSGPKMVSASLSGTQVTVTITHDGGSDFMPTTNISGFYFYDGATAVSVNAAVRTNATTVTLTLAATPVSGGYKLYYGFDDMAGIVLANILHDNTVNAMPLRTGVISFS